ncbi:protein mab-21-like 3 [Pleurodeles waltl]|uniref:protein mab-21-like 3 n=1 Tax=Pleurodeles waltl TaxID=8319 RepID=UPI00370962F8
MPRMPGSPPAPRGPAATSQVSEPDEFDFLVPVLALPALSLLLAAHLTWLSEQPPDASFQAVGVRNHWWSDGARTAGVQDWVTAVDELPRAANSFSSFASYALFWYSYFYPFLYARVGLLSPGKVIGAFRELVRSANSSTAVTVRPLQQGTPAVTLTMPYYPKQISVDPKQISVDPKQISVDLVPLIKNPFGWCNIPWPREGKPWPSPEKIHDIKATGVDLVAKHPLYWRYSFSRVERVLLEKIDDDGGRRRDSLRILKKVGEDCWKKKYGKVLVSYHLKTVLFWACEFHHLPDDWKDLTKSFKRLVDYLEFYLQKKCLPHYFLGSAVNLFKPEHSSRLQDLLCDVIKFKMSPMNGLKL